MNRRLTILVNSLLVLAILGLIFATWLPAIYTAMHANPK
jgi:hypothetical protein